MSASTPTACTLPPGDFAGRIAWITDLNRTALRSHHRAGHTLTLVYAPDAAARLAELVRRERACCPFLRFTRDETSDAVRLTVELPAAAADPLAAAALFEPFLAGAPRRPGPRPRPCTP